MRTSRRSSLAGAGKIPGCPLGETMSIKQRFEREPIYLMDGSAFVYRGFYANQSMQRSDGFPTSALFIVARILMRILREEQPRHFAFVLDGHGPNFRHELFPLYKAQRSATPEDLIKQIDPSIGSSRRSACTSKLLRVTIFSSLLAGSHIMTLSCRHCLRSLSVATRITGCSSR